MFVNTIKRVLKTKLYMSILMIIENNKSSDKKQKGNQYIQVHLCNKYQYTRYHITHDCYTRALL